MKQEIKKIKKQIGRPIIEPVFIERINEKDLTSAARRRIHKVDADVKAGKSGGFATLEELAKSIERRRSHPLE